jgi:hypothetical protein
MRSPYKQATMKSAFYWSRAGHLRKTSSLV